MKVRLELFRENGNSVFQLPGILRAKVIRPDLNSIGAARFSPVPGKGIWGGC